MNSPDLSNLLFDSKIKPMQYWLDAYPARALSSAAEVTRLCPSPTGFLHLGALYMGVINRRIASDSGGVFYLRIEDTDTDREVQGARALIVEGLGKFGITFDEGFLDGENQFGAYAPYLQTQRGDIYASFVRELVLQGRAYPCFMTKEELLLQRTQQEADKVRPGYYGRYAVWRDAPMEKVQEKLQSGTPFVLRFKSMGDQNIKRSFSDEFLGDIQVPQNDEDFVLLKTNGIPTYHLAHIVDDHLMGTTFVIRGMEWLSSVGKHLELWESFGFDIPRYGHLAPINKREGSTVRKLSKRKDPEADIMRYDELGYPTDALIGYLYRLANPSFDDWWQSEPRASVWDFPFSVKELQKGGGGPLIDFDKLADISKNVISRMTAQQVYDLAHTWATVYDAEFAQRLSEQKEYFIRIFNIERGGPKPRKDFSKWSEVKESVSYFFDDQFDAASLKDSGSFPAHLDKALVAEVLRAYADRLQGTPFQSTRDEWFDDLKKFAVEREFADDMRAYKAEPEKFKGSVADIAMMLRVALTGRTQTPDLFEMISVMTVDRVANRLRSVAEIL